MTAAPRAARAATRAGRLAHGAAARAILARHERIAGPADRRRRHHHQRHGSFHRLFGQYDIEAAFRAPPASDEIPSQIAGAVSPDAIRRDRSGTGMRTTK